MTLNHSDSLIPTNKHAIFLAMTEPLLLQKSGTMSLDRTRSRYAPRATRYTSRARNRYFSISNLQFKKIITKNLPQKSGIRVQVSQMAQ